MDKKNIKASEDLHKEKNPGKLCGMCAGKA